MKKLLLCLGLLIITTTGIYAQKSIFISPSGDDRNEGSQNAPLRSLGKALDCAGKASETDVCIYFREGTYYLNAPEVITTDRIGNKHLLITSWNNESVTISGSPKLTLQWVKAKGSLWKASVTDHIDQLWINGEKKIMARYPNYQEGVLFNGTSEDALSPQRIRKWKNPEGGFIHSLHAGMWGSQHYLITGKAKDAVTYTGGYQVSRPSKIHPRLRFVENIKEELDAPNEWFWDEKEKTLYYYPSPGESPENVETEISATPQLIIVRGSANKPMTHVSIEKLCFTHTNRTFMEPYETLLRSDWGIYRGAAVLLENTQDCKVANCKFKELGGNAIFVSRYALNDTIKSNHIHHTGGSAICLVGDTSAVRSGAYGYSNYIPYEQMDLTPGPKNNLYPRQCIVEDNLIHDLGTVEKQVAGVEIQIAAMINVRHNTIYDIPRAGINIGDGAFGGHIIEYNDVFNTVLETSDHGAFNSWGRDRFWHPNYQTMNKLTQEHPEIILLDALYTTTIRNNRFRCDHGWDIDLDDGSSNYHIYNNVCLRGGIKLREGFYRTVENNILINGSLHPHVWFPKSEDVIQRNLFMQPYYPISLSGWGKKLDYNFFSTQMAVSKVQEKNTDKHSISGKFEFANADKGDYTVSKGSDVFLIGFENIPMDRFGVYTPSLKEKARQPEFPKVQIINISDENKIYDWLGAKIRVVKGLGDRSAFGLPDEKGIVIVEVGKGSLADKANLQKNDVIRSINNEEVSSIETILAVTEQVRWKGNMTLTFFRNQEEQKMNISLK